MKRNKTIMLLFVIGLAISSCSKDESGPNSIDPSNANALSEVLIMPIGTQ